MTEVTNSWCLQAFYWSRLVYRHHDEVGVHLQACLWWCRHPATAGGTPPADLVPAVCLQKPDARYNVQLAKRLHGLEHHKVIWVKPSDIKASDLLLVWALYHAAPAHVAAANAARSTWWAAYLGTAAAFSTAPWLTAPQPLQLMYRKLMLQPFRGAT